MAKASDNGLEVAESLKRLSSIHVTAQRLGVSTFTVRRLIKTGALKSVRISRRVMVPESAIASAVENGCER
jgi:excisionase family DNA binding protein